MSRNGRYVLYSRIRPGSPVEGFDVRADLFAWDRVTGSRVKVTTADGGTDSEIYVAYRWTATISNDGRFVTYSSRAPRIVTDDHNGEMDVFLWDRQTLTTSMVSRASDGTGLDDESYSAVISADGRYITYVSSASNAPDSPSNPYHWTNLFAWDRLGDTD